MALVGVTVAGGPPLTKKEVWRPPLVWGRWRSGWLGSAAGAQMEPLPGNTAESHLPVFPHAVGAQSNTPTCVLPLVGLGLTGGNE